jgi:hypothetical protein
VGTPASKRKVRFGHEVGVREFDKHTPIKMPRTDVVELKPVSDDKPPVPACVQAGKVQGGSPKRTPYSARRSPSKQSSTVHRAGRAFTTTPSRAVQEAWQELGCLSLGSGTPSKPSRSPGRNLVRSNSTIRPQMPSAFARVPQLEKTCAPETVNSVSFPLFLRVCLKS